MCATSTALLLAWQQEFLWDNDPSALVTSDPGFALVHLEVQAPAPGDSQHCCMHMRVLFQCPSFY